jgi:hypothetical protein
MSYLNVATFNKLPWNLAKCAQKNPKKTFVAFAWGFLFIATMQKFTQKKTIDHDHPKLSITQLYFWYHQKPNHETGYKFLISQFLNQQSKSYSI